MTRAASAGDACNDAEHDKIAPHPAGQMLVCSTEVHWHELRVSRKEKL